MSDMEYMSRVRGMERKLYRIASAILFSDADSADAIQEAVFKGWMRRDGLREEKYFESWLIRILINECKNILRRRKRAPLPLNEEARLRGAPEDMELSLHLRRCLAELPEKLRVPLLLHHLEGYGLADIARMLGLAPTLVKSRLYQARRALKNTLDQGGEAHENAGF